MGRKRTRNYTQVNGNLYDFVPFQIVLKGQIKDMFIYDLEYRDMSISQLGAMIFKEHYRRNPPIGFFKDQKQK